MNTLLLITKAFLIAVTIVTMVVILLATFAAFEKEKKVVQMGFVR